MASSTHCTATHKKLPVIFHENNSLKNRIKFQKWNCRKSVADIFSKEWGGLHVGMEIFQNSGRWHSIMVTHSESVPRSNQATDRHLNYGIHCIPYLRYTFRTPSTQLHTATHSTRLTNLSQSAARKTQEINFSGCNNNLFFASQSR